MAIFNLFQVNGLVDNTQEKFTPLYAPGQMDKLSQEEPF